MISARMMKISARMSEAIGTSTEHVFGAIHTDRLNLAGLRNSTRQVSDNIREAGKALSEKTNITNDTFIKVEKVLPKGKEVE